MGYSVPCRNDIIQKTAPNRELLIIRDEINGPISRDMISSFQTSIDGSSTGAPSRRRTWFRAKCWRHKSLQKWYTLVLRWKCTVCITVAIAGCSSPHWQQWLNRLSCIVVPPAKKWEEQQYRNDGVDDREEYDVQAHNDSPNKVRIPCYCVLVHIYVVGIYGVVS